MHCGCVVLGVMGWTVRTTGMWGRYTVAPLTLTLTSRSDPSQTRVWASQAQRSVVRGVTSVNDNGPVCNLSRLSLLEVRSV